MITISVYLKCSKCESELEAEEKDGSFQVTPCRWCLDNATAEAYANGYNDGGEKLESVQNEYYGKGYSDGYSEGQHDREDRG